MEKDLKSTQPADLEKQPGSKFRRGLELLTKVVTKKPEVEGLDNLRELGQTPAVFAISHLTDTDPTIAAVALSYFRNLDVASLQTNQRDFGKFLNLLGGNRFHDVANTYDTEKNMPHTSFDTQNYDDMKQAMEQGRDMVIAAHKPVRDGRIPDKAGVGDVYLAHLTDAPIIPIAVDIHSETPAGMATDYVKTIRRALIGQRPSATIRIGKAISFDRMSPEELQDVGSLLMGKRDELRQDDTRYQRTLGNYNLLRQQSEEVLAAISDLLPPEKRRQEVTDGKTEVK